MSAADEHRCETCGLADGPDYGDPHECPPGFMTEAIRRQLAEAWDEGWEHRDEMESVRCPPGDCNPYHAADPERSNR